MYSAWSQKASNYIRACSPTDTSVKPQTLESVNTTSELVFRTNHRLVVLNDTVNGNVWNPEDSTKVIKIQWNKIQTEQTEKEQQNNDSANNHHDFSKTCSAQSGQIKAEDDEIGARAGSEQILDVLRNDEQTDCSVLKITKVGAPNNKDVTISPIYDGRYLQLDASAASAGTVTFTYDISDGRGQTSSATVTVTLNDGGNHAPVQFDTPPEIDVEQGASYTANALSSFNDPDGDPLTLVSAVAQNTDQVQVSTRADGQLTFNTGALASGRVGVEVTVSDGTATGTGMVYFSVKPANTLAAVIDPVAKTTVPNTDTVVKLSSYVHGTSLQPAQLTQVDTPNGASTTTNAADMSLTFKATNPGTYYVPYTITQGSIPATGLARVEVQPATGEAAKPVAANDVALLGADNTAIVEPLTNDVDPMGGVLSVTTVSAPADSGIKIGLVSHKRVYITAAPGAHEARRPYLHRGQRLLEPPRAPSCCSRRLWPPRIQCPRPAISMPRCVPTASCPWMCLTMWPTRMAPRSNSRTTCNTTRGRSRVWPSSLETRSATKHPARPATSPSPIRLKTIW